MRASPLTPLQPTPLSAPLARPAFPRRYRARFASVLQGAGAASGSNSNIFYSFDLGLVHYLGFSAEAYAYRSGATFLANQLDFMTKDLAAVDRLRTPWVVALVHKDFDMESEAFQAFYPVLEGGKVDVLFCGHIHYVRRARRAQCRVCRTAPRVLRRAAQRCTRVSSSRPPRSAAPELRVPARRPL